MEMMCVSCHGGTLANYTNKFNQLDVQWLEPQDMQVAMRKLAEQWYPSQKSISGKLADVMVDIWSARQGLIPHPDIALCETESVLGLLCGCEGRDRQCFWIQEVLIHPEFAKCEEDIVVEKLIQAAIDRSVLLGYHGWVACQPLQEDEAMWIRFKFHRSELGFRRMGYFAR
ncbi:hypothetical protein [Alicyclobacillus dauci]|uniref:Uncharacterized protein n=1 Tax=Alicyclobacillus dauci TaxID=1475485 RepID=A0ABY6Z753_9BACL|nr:hypothetical protein [Alicyclobacillus dauci]WAH38358.1 hypothetical protein NZD86_07735 [Alicyclobacillus dauci]